MKLYNVYEFMRKVGVTQVELIADMEEKGFLTPENQTLAGTRYYSKQQIKNFDYLYSLYVDFCRKQANKQMQENAVPTVQVVGNTLKPLTEDLKTTNPLTEYTFENAIIAPTCTSKGYTEHVCNENPSKTYRDSETKALGHDYSKSVDKPSCGKEGSETFTCTRCQHSYSNKLKALEHKYKITQEIKATCITEGKIVKQCSLCNDTLEDILAPLGHDYTEVVIEEGSCTVDRIISRQCTRCDEKDEHTIKAPGHDYNIETVEVTCISEGYTKKTCKVCGIEEKIDIIAPTGHNFTEEVTIEPTEHSVGKKVFTCSTCGYTQEEEIPVLEPKVDSAFDILASLQAIQEENKAEVQKGEEEVRQYEEQFNNYTGPVKVTGKKRF